MKLFGFNISIGRKSTIDINTLVQRLEAVHATHANLAVNPDSAMRSPTVHAIVTAISRRISTLPIKVMRTRRVAGRIRKTDEPDHPIARLLENPNGWQDRVSFWLDATSWIVRYGNFYAVKAQGRTGPPLYLQPLSPRNVTAKFDGDTLTPSYVWRSGNGSELNYTPRDIIHARGPARDGFLGDSPVLDLREAIALEIVAETMGASVFGNSAMPSLVFSYAAGSQAHKTEEERLRFIESVQNTYTGRGRFKALLLPKGVELGTPVPIDNEKAQFLATRQYQRTVIAGGFGVPPHFVGDLTKGTFANVEQQSLDFVVNVVLPYVRIFEAALERSLLTPEDRANGVIIRFNIDAALRGDFKSRQEGLNIQRQAGVISPNDWLEMEGRNPISPDDGGEDYWRKGPSGQSAEPPATSQTPVEPTQDDPNPA